MLLTPQNPAAAAVGGSTSRPETATANSTMPEENNTDGRYNIICAVMMSLLGGAANGWTLNCGGDIVYHAKRDHGVDDYTPFLSGDTQLLVDYC